MTLTRKYFVLTFGLILAAAVLSGCGNKDAKRTYTEITLEASAAPVPAAPMHSNIPMDDIHAFLREGGQMPMDDIHAALGGAQGQMPNDDIHAAVRNAQDQGGAAPMMGMGNMDAQTQAMLSASMARVPLSWQTPKGWKEQKGSGMRLATFTASGKGGAVECSVISLAGAAGGLESNVVRWMNQVGVAPPADIAAFIAGETTLKTADGFPATIVDLASLQKGLGEQTRSMIGTVLQLPDMTVFIKMTGPKGAVTEQRDAFESLCRSMKVTPNE